MTLQVSGYLENMMWLGLDGHLRQSNIWREKGRGKVMDERRERDEITKSGKYRERERESASLGCPNRK